jgi:hypothetical protein
MPAYRLTLYKQHDNIWQYCQMTATRSRKLVTALGNCGDKPDHVTESALPQGQELFDSVRDAGQQWRSQGYDYPRRKDMLVMTLHFRLPGTTSGWPAGAPWFEDWKTHYQEPVEQMLTDTANGFSNGTHRVRGHLLLYYYVLNAEAAANSVRQIAASAPINFPMDIHIGDKPMRPGIHLNESMPDPLADMYKGFEQMAITLAEASQSVTFHAVTLTPQPVHESSRQRVKGLQAQVLRMALKERWGFECDHWPPLGGKAREEVVFVDSLDTATETELLRLLQERIQLPVYLLDCEEGFFKIEPDNIFRGAFEGVVFDDGLEWIIYFSHHGTITFGGSWLIDAVKTVYNAHPEKVNPC